MDDLEGKNPYFWFNTHILTGPSIPLGASLLSSPLLSIGAQAKIIPSEGDRKKAMKGGQGGRTLGMKRAAEFMSKENQLHVKLTPKTHPK